MRPKRLPYNFSEKAIDHYYESYFQKKHIDDEDNIAILSEIVLVSVGSKEAYNDLQRCISPRLYLIKSCETTYEFLFKFFNHPQCLINSKIFQEEYFKFFDNPFKRKDAWNDLIYKLKSFKHLHPDLNFDFENPYENSDELLF